MFAKREKDGVTYYVSPILEKAGFTHAFFARFGGASFGDFDSLNVSTARKNHDGCTDSARNVDENYRRALAVLGTEPSRASAAKQVHSATVRTVTPSDGGRGVTAVCGSLPDCDGIVLKAELAEVDAVCVKTADCVPILLGNRATGDVCAVHAGWRGSAADIVTVAARTLAPNGSENLVAAIGPCIGSCCYEIGGEVYEAFASLFRSKRYGFDVDSLFPVFPSCSLGGKRHLDLAAANRELLVLCGVERDNIDLSGMCTCCHHENGEYPFFSHRRSGGFSGTFVSAIRSRRKI